MADLIKYNINTLEARCIRRNIYNTCKFFTSSDFEKIKSQNIYEDEDMWNWCIVTSLEQFEHSMATEKSLISLYRRYINNPEDYDALAKLTMIGEIKYNYKGWNGI